VIRYVDVTAALDRSVAESDCGDADEAKCSAELTVRSDAALAVTHKHFIISSVMSGCRRDMRISLSALTVLFTHHFYRPVAISK